MVRTECSSVKIVAPRKRAARHALHSVSHWRRELPNKIVDGRMGQRERQSIPRGGMVTKGVAPALRAAGPLFQFARLNENLDVACRLYNDVRWREGLPRALVAKDDQGDSNSFLHVFGARNSFWRLARCHVHLLIQIGSRRESYRTPWCCFRVLLWDHSRRDSGVMGVTCGWKWRPFRYA